MIAASATHEGAAAGRPLGRRTVRALVGAGLLLAPGLMPDQAQAAHARFKASQSLVSITTTHRARVHPRGNTRQVAIVDARRPITGVRTVLPVLARTHDKGGRPWVRVRLPGRTFGRPTPPHTAWIRAWHTRRSSTPWRLLVDLSAHRVFVYLHGRKRRSFSVIVGKPSTPTPHGYFFVEENIRMRPGAAGAPFALATSARSHVFQEFDGGPGQIALYGLVGVGGRVGTSVSHGCVRLNNRSIGWLAARIRPGVPVTIQR